jgi:hypothetical protein
MTNPSPGHSEKSPSDGKSSFRRSWSSTSPLTRIWIIIVAAGAIAILWQNWQARRLARMESRPLVVNSRPPELLQPLVCDPKSHALTTGNVRIFLKNAGNARAVNVVPSLVTIKLVPEKKTGNASLDDLPSVNCDLKPPTAKDAFNLAPGQQRVTQVSQSVMSVSGLPQGAAVQLYLVSCVDYSDEHGSNDATCDMYRFNLPSSDPMDVLSGNPIFFCDGIPRAGRFVAAIAGHCQK